MPLPIDLILIRHGKSESNIANDAMKHGDDSWYTPEYKSRQDIHTRLTYQGQQQAEQTGDFIRHHIGDNFDLGLVSAHIRTRETAARLNLNINWELEPLISERNWGLWSNLTQAERDQHFHRDVAAYSQNRMYWQPPRGESLIDVMDRSQTVLNQLTDRSQRAILVTHKEFILSARVHLEGLDPLHYRNFKSHPDFEVNNCQIIQYSRQSPFDGHLASRYQFVRTICAWNRHPQSETWRPFTRQKYTNSQLLAEVDQYPRLFEK